MKLQNLLTCYIKDKTLEESNYALTNKFFGRDRCDCLPSRNRTTTGTTAQSSASLSTSNSTVLFLRSHPQESSATINNIASSQSDEFSISFNEFDDHACLPSYKFNHISEKSIPEENQDDLIYSDMKRSFEDTTADKTYLSMSPDNPKQISKRYFSNDPLISVQCTRNSELQDNTSTKINNNKNETDYQ